MHRCRAIKKKTRNRLILLQNLKKGKARQESRCGYQLIPLPAKFAYSSRIHYLPADTVLMERDDTFVSEASLFNNFKTYKTAHIVEYPTQKVIKLKVENKNNDNDNQISDWKQIIEKLENSESDSLKQWANPIKNYCERYETLIKELQHDQQEMSAERYKALLQKNDMTEKIRQTLFKTNPCIEFKSQLKDGKIQLTEISVSEKYLGELGYSLETFSATVLQEGLPEVTPLDSEGASVIAKLRLQKYLTTDQDGYQTPEFESSVIMKNGCLKKVKLRIHYHTCYEKGVPGFVFIGAIIAKQKPMIRNLNATGEIKLNTDYIEMMSRQEENMNMFLQAYYNQTVEQKFTNIHKICKIKEIKDLDGVL